MRVLVLNGPNLNLLGTREPGIYGSETLADLEDKVASWGSAMGVQVESFQSNHEGALIDQLQRDDVDGIVFNPAAYTHTSRALADTIAAIDRPVVEVHISNVKARESWRAVSLIEDVVSCTIFGRGLTGYRDALRHLVNFRAGFETLRYGSHPEQLVDLWGTGGPAVILVHGGFWRNEWKRDTMESLAADLVSRGCSVYNVEYRRLGSDGGWPETPDDVARALDFAAEHARQQHIRVIGHSAGAHLAMFAAHQGDLPIGQLVGLAPIVDLERHARSQMYGAPEAQALLDSGAPERVSPGATPTLLVHGEADRHVPIAHSADLARDESLELMSTTTGHFELLDPRRDHWPGVLSRLAL